MKIEIDNKFSELNRRVKLTSKARYNASRRLSLQNTLSRWTLALLSVALILISVVSASDLPLKFSSSYIDIMQIIFAVLVLSYSLLLATGDYSARAVRIHRCGMELGRLARKIKPFENSSDNDEEYSSFYNDYYNCLEKYENHGTVDFLVADFSSIDWYGKSQLSDTSGLEKYLLIFFISIRRVWIKVRIYWGEFYPIAHYFISIASVYYWLFLMVLGNA